MFARKLQQSAIALFMTVVSFAGCSNDAAPKNVSFTIETKRDDDRVEVQADANQATFSIQSPFGISQATIKRQSSTWPKAIVLKLHIHGLEKFRVANGQFAINASVSSSGVKPVIRVWKDDTEAKPLHNESPEWIDIRIRNQGSKDAATIPLQDGYFEMTLPNSIVRDNPQAIEVQWIDFYRG